MNPRGYRAGRGSIRVSLDFGQHPKERDKKKNEKLYLSDTGFKR